MNAIKHISRALLSLALILSFSPASANPEVVKAAVEAWLKGKYKVDGVIKSPVTGLYEARIGTDLIYVDEKGQFAFVEGQLIDIKANKNLTQERVDELLKVNFNDLPLDLALKQVFGNGKRRLAVFEDPNCPHCRTTRLALNDLKDATVYTFTYPILAADSEVKVRQALCAKDKLKAWNDLMLMGKIPANDGSCQTALPKIVELGRKLRVTGTPTLIFANGKRVPGGVPPEQLRKLLEENSKV